MKGHTTKIQMQKHLIPKTIATYTLCVFSLFSSTTNIYIHLYFFLGICHLIGLLYLNLLVLILLQPFLVVQSNMDRTLFLSNNKASFQLEGSIFKKHVIAFLKQAQFIPHPTYSKSLSKAKRNFLIALVCCFSQLILLRSTKRGTRVFIDSSKGFLPLLIASIFVPSTKRSSYIQFHSTKLLLDAMCSMSF